MKLALLFAGLFTATALHAAPVYNNTETDTFDTVVYSANAYTEIGDRIKLAGTERSANSATVQFYNAGTGGGDFGATLNFYSLGLNDAVGSALGTSYSVAGNVGVDGILDVTWLLAGLDLPDELFFTVSVNNFAAGMDLGLNLFDPFTIGSSDGGFFVARDRDTNSIGQRSTLGGHDNIYFQLNATDGNRIPEPGTAGLMFLAFLPLFAVRLRRRVS